MLHASYILYWLLKHSRVRLNTRDAERIWNIHTCVSSPIGKRSHAGLPRDSPSPDIAKAYRANLRVTHTVIPNAWHKTNAAMPDTRCLPSCRSSEQSQPSAAEISAATCQLVNLIPCGHLSHMFPQVCRLEPALSPPNLWVGTVSLQSPQA